MHLPDFTTAITICKLSNVFAAFNCVIKTLSYNKSLVEKHVLRH